MCVWLIWDIMHYRVKSFNKVLHFLKSYITSDALHDLMVFAQIKKCEKHPRMRVTFSKVAVFRGITPPWVLFTFLKLYIWYQIVQNVSYCCSFSKGLRISQNWNSSSNHSVVFFKNYFEDVHDSQRKLTGMDFFSGWLLNCCI